MKNKKAPNSLIGVRNKNKLIAIFAEIAAYEKEATKLLAKTALAYYNAGNIISGEIQTWPYKDKDLSAKNVGAEVGVPDRSIILALKIFKHFENNPDALKGLTMRETLKLITPPPPAGEAGYNRADSGADLGGDSGQMQFGFDELFQMPAVANRALQNYRTVGDLVSEILVVRRTKDGSLISKRFAQFSEDLPQNTALKLAYKTMSQKTQAAIEDYLAACEQEEAGDE